MPQTSQVRGTATKVHTDAQGTHVHYHNTEVVTIHRNGDVTLRTGGWMTNTTKLRMNQAANQFRLGFQVFQRNFGWFVQVGGLEAPFVGDEMRIKAEMMQ